MTLFSEPERVKRNWRTKAIRRSGSGPEEAAKRAPVTVRPQAQAVFCIDVRSESLRRHLEAIGDYETFGFAGFFNAAIRYQALGNHHETDQFPVILKAKNVVREIPRTYQGQFHLKHQARTQSYSTRHTPCCTISKKTSPRPMSWSSLSAGSTACR